MPNIFIIRTNINHYAHIFITRRKQVTLMRVTIEELAYGAGAFMINTMFSDSQNTHLLGQKSPFSLIKPLVYANQ